MNVAGKTVWRLAVIGLSYLVLTWLLPDRPHPMWAAGGAVAVYLGLAVTFRAIAYLLFLKPDVERGRVLRGAGLELHAMETPDPEDLGEPGSWPEEQAFVWLEVTVTPVSAMARRPWEPHELALADFDDRVRPSFKDQLKAGFVRETRYAQSDKVIHPPQRLRGPKQLRLLAEMTSARARHVKLQYFFETFGDLRIPASALWTVDAEAGAREFRGLGCEDTEAEMLLVAAPVEAVAGALARHLGLILWMKDAWGERFEPRNAAWAVFRIQGHNWTVAGCTSVRASRMRSAAAVLSRELATEVIHVVNSDTVGVTEYTLLRDGDRLEVFYSGEGHPGLDSEDYELFEERAGDVLAFTSELRQPDRGELEAHGRFVDAFLRRRDAYAPPETWRKLEPAIANRQREPRLEIDGLTGETCQRLDYLAP